MIVGIGTDIIEVPRIAALWLSDREGLKRRVFLPIEVSYCEAMHEPAQHLAARFAAKEAALKAIGTGMADGLGLRDIEVSRELGGRPVLRFHGAAAMRIRTLGVQRSWVTLTHTEAFAAATVVLERGIDFDDSLRPSRPRQLAIPFPE